MISHFCFYDFWNSKSSSQKNDKVTPTPSTDQIMHIIEPRMVNKCRAHSPKVVTILYENMTKPNIMPSIQLDKGNLISHMIKFNQWECIILF